MARKALIAKQKRKEYLVEKYAKKRKELKANGDYEGLQKLPRMSRLVFRELALQGKIPGVIKSSW